MWWISGGVPGLIQLANYYCMPSADAAWHGGMEAVVELDQWQEVLAANPGNRDRFLSMDRQEFLATMDRWMLAYCPCDDSLVPGLDDDDVARLDGPDPGVPQRRVGHVPHPRHLRGARCRAARCRARRAAVG